MFKYPLTKPLKFNLMHSKCPHCQLDYHPEPGFYFGAAYFSYAFNIALFVTITVGLTVLSKERPPASTYIFAIVGSVVVLLPMIFRWSRALMLYIAGGAKYDPDAGA